MFEQMVRTFTNMGSNESLTRNTSYIKLFPGNVILGRMVKRSVSPTDVTLKEKVDAVKNKRVYG